MLPKIRPDNRALPLLACLLLACSVVRAEDDPMRELTKGQPKDVASVMTRIAMCTHFAGEEPYDAARRRELDAAFKKYRCEQLDKDEAALRKRYQGNQSVHSALQKAREW